MREIQLCKPKKREPQVVEWLAFDPTGVELIARVDDALLVCDLRTDVVGPLFGDENLHHWIEGDEVTAVALSPDRRLLATSFDLDESNYTAFAEPPGRDYQLPYVGDESGCAGLMFTPDGKELVAAWNHWTGGYEPSVMRLPLAPILAPKRLVEKRNPLNGQVYKTPAHKPTWKNILTLPGGAPATTAALSANGRLVAAGTEDGTVHVADLKKKKTLASFAWEGRKLRDRAVKRIGFSPTGARVASLAGGRLFVRPLGAGASWWTKDALGPVHDFAFHPAGRVLCAACADGQARFLDAHTGLVRQSFQWAKKPKPLHSVCFAPDGLTCTVGSENGKVIVWDVDL